MHSLRIKITALTVTAILASLLAVALAGFFTVGQETTASSAEKMRLLSETAQQSLDASLNSVRQSVEMTSHIATDTIDSVTLVECGAANPAAERTPEQVRRLDASIAEHVSHVQHAFGSMANHTNGVVAYYYCINPSIGTTRKGFFFSKMGKVGFEQQEPLDVQGLDPNDPEAMAWYFAPIEYGMPTWVGPYRSHTLADELVVSYVVPIYRSGIQVGLLGMDVLFSTLADQVASVEVYRTGYAFLLDQDGRALYHPLLEAGAFPQYVEELVAAGQLSGESSGNHVIRYLKDGQSWQLAYSTLLNGAKLAVAAPVSEVVAPWRNLVVSIPIIALMVMAIFVPLTLMGVRAIISPLQQLTEAAHSLASGNYDMSLDYRGHDEVGELTNAFRRLRDHLQVYISDVNSATYTDPLTGVKSRSAYRIYAARLDDAISHRKKSDEPRFAIVLFRCAELDRVCQTYGREREDAYIRTACQHICQIYSASPVFRIGEGSFAVFAEQRDYHNRLELLRDFELTADLINAQTDDEWLRIRTAKGMATFRPTEDANVEAVLRRAQQRMGEDEARRQDGQQRGE